MSEINVGNQRTEDTPAPEVVGRFEARAAFQGAVEDLLAAGFERSDLSVLDTHESLSASESGATAWQETLAGLVGEVRFVGPIATAGLIMVAAGPVGAAISGVIAAGLVGMALKDALEEVRATPHTEDFAKALERGALLLWVRAPSAQRQASARAILVRHGAADVHTHERPAQQGPADAPTGPAS